TVSVPAEISRPRVGPGAAFKVADTGRLADFLSFTALELESSIIAPRAIDRGLHRAVARLDHPGPAHARDAAIVAHAGRHAVLQPADRHMGGVTRVTETPGAATPVALADQRA